MIGKIYDLSNNLLKTVSLSGDINIVGTNKIKVCQDISSYVGNIIRIYNGLGNVYNGFIRGYSDGYIIFSHITYLLDTKFFTDTIYNNTSIEDILTDIINDFNNNTSYSFFSTTGSEATNIRVSLTFKGKTHLEAISILQGYLGDFRLVYNLGGGTVNYKIVKSDAAQNITTNRKIGNNTLINTVGIVNKVTVNNGGDITVTVSNSTSISQYGEYARTYTVPTITTTDEANSYAYNILDKYSNPKKVIDKIKIDNLDINNVNQKISFDGSIKFIIGGYITQSDLFYDTDIKPINEKFVNVNIDIEGVTRLIQEGTNLVGIRGWTNSITFIADDYNTVSWNDGKIHMPNGDQFSINAGTTGDMSDVTYIYLDTNVSTTELQTTINAATAVGKNKLLVCVAGPNSDSSKKATFQAFGTNSQSTFITADNIAANSITANEIAANTITANEIATGAITTDKIVVGAVDSSKVNFNYAGSSSKGGAANDTDNVAGTASWVVRDGANKADLGLNNSGLYRKWLETGNMVDRAGGGSVNTGVVYDASGIRGYYSGNKTFEINATNGNAFFKGTIGASNIESGGYIEAYNSSNDRIWLGMESGLPKIKFYDSGTYVGDLYGDNLSISLGGTTYNKKLIKASTDFGVNGDLFVGDDIVIGDSTLIGGDLYVYNGGSTAAFYVRGGKAYMPQGINNGHTSGELPVVTSGYIANAGLYVATSSGGSNDYVLGCYTVNVNGISKSWLTE